MLPRLQVSVQAFSLLRFALQVEGKPERPRLAVYRSNNHIYAQVKAYVSLTSIGCLCSKMPLYPGGGMRTEGLSRLEVSQRSPRRRSRVVVLNRKRTGGASVTSARFRGSLTFFMLLN
jgi:Ribosomal L18 of archaea, bacteria, mitoch. and chloroplast